MGFFKNIFGKKETPDPHVARREDQPDVYHVSSEEDEMNNAMEKARLTIGYFKESLAVPKPGQSYFSLKAKIIDGNEVEHIWLNDASFDESNNAYGHIGNKPLSLQNVKQNQKVGVPFENISDWMIIENGRLIGGYTIRVLRNKMAGAQLKAFDNSTGMYIDEGVDYFAHDLTTPEGAILCLEDAYDAKDIDRAMACKDFYEEAKLMLSKQEELKAALNNEEALQSLAEVIRLSFIKHTTDNFPSFAGIERGFPKREVVNENLVIVTEVCFYPDNTKSLNKLYVCRKQGEWKVLSLAE